MSPDLRLVTAAAEGDDHAFTRWLEPLRPQLVRYAAEKLGGDQAEAEDVVQDAAMRALLALRGGKVPANPRAWMYVIVRNRCHDVRSARRPAAPLDEAYGLCAADAAPEEQAAARRRLHAVVDALGELPDAQRRAIVSATFEGRPYEEIAAREATSVQAVKSLVHRARQGLEASGARAAALVPGLFAFRARVRGAGEGVAAVVSQHTAAASVAAVAAVAVPVVTTIEQPAPRPAAAHARVTPPAAPARARAATSPAGAGRAAPAAEVLAACASGRSLARYDLRSLRAAQQAQPASDAEYGGGCATRLLRAMVRQG